MLRYVQMRYARVFLVVVLCLWVANTLVFGVMAAALGGDELNGHVTNGHYFLAMHGSYREVSREVWRYSWWHGIIYLWTTPLMLLAAIGINRIDAAKSS